jgi:hypothetical protein
MEFSKVYSFIRKRARFIAGLAFWLNALFILPIPQPALSALGHKLGLDFPEMALGLFLGMMALLNCYGFRNFAVDLLYIYFFPFILGYRLVVLSFKTCRGLARSVSTVIPGARPKITWKDFLQQLTPDPSVLTPKALVVPPPAQPMIAAALPTESRHGALMQLVLKISLPFREFTIAWCLLILLSHKVIFVSCALAVLTGHTARFVIELVRTLTEAKQFLKRAEREVFAYVEDLLNTMMSATEESFKSPEIVKANQMLALLRTGAFLLINRAEISYMFFLALCFAYFVVYTRLALLFAFVYIGIAKINHIPLGFLESFVNSLAMPFSFTNLPRNWAIQLAELTHTATVLFLGFGALITYFQQKLEAFAGIAESLWSRLDQEAVRQKMASAAKTSAPQPAAPTT